MSIPQITLLTSVSNGGPQQPPVTQRKRPMPTPSATSSHAGSRSRAPLNAKKVRFTDPIITVALFKIGSPPSQAQTPSKAEEVYDSAFYDDTMDVHEDWYSLDRCIDYVKKVLRQYRQAAEMGHGGAKEQFAHFTDEDLSQDPVNKESWLRTLADKGLVCAQYLLGRCYLEGIGVKQNPQEAIKWLKISADAGHGSACYHLGLCYSKGEGVELNPKTAFGYFKQGACKNNDSAMYELATCRLEGIGCKQEIGKGIRWLKKAADKGHIEAAIELALCHLNGIGVTKDLEEAQETLSFWANVEEVPRAQYHLGLCYIDRIFIDETPEAGLELIKLAADSKYPDALEYLKERLA